jgi:hypothetical protein
MLCCVENIRIGMSRRSCRSPGSGALAAPGEQLKVLAVVVVVHVFMSESDHHPQRISFFSLQGGGAHLNWRTSRCCRRPVRAECGSRTHDHVPPCPLQNSDVAFLAIFYNNKINNVDPFLGSFSWWKRRLTKIIKALSARFFLFSVFLRSAPAWSSHFVLVVVVTTDD